MPRIHFNRLPVKDTKTSVVPEKGARPVGSVPARVGRVAGHPPDIEPLNQDAWKAEHRQQSLVRSPRAALTSLKGFLRKARPGTRGATGSSLEAMDDEADTDVEPMPRPSHKADAAFSAASALAPRAAALVVRGGLLQFNGSRDVSVPASNPLAADTPELTMPGAMPVEPSAPGATGRESVGQRLFGGTARAAKGIARLPERAGTALHDDIAERAFMGAVAGSGLFLRGAANAATNAAIGAVTSRLPVPAKPLPAVVRGDVLMPGTFPGTEAAVNADLRPGLLDPARAAASQARAKALDAAAHAAFEGGVASGRLLLQGGLQALDRRFPSLPPVVPTRRAPGTFPQDAAPAAPARIDPPPVPSLPSTPPPAYVADAHDSLPAYDDIAHDLPPGYDMPNDAAPKPPLDPAPRMPGSWID